MQGWIKLHRKIMCSPVWNEPGMLKLWIYCLVKATHKEKEILLGQQLIKLSPGQFVTGRNSLYDDLNKGVKPANKVSAITLWRWLKVLEKMGNIELKTNNKFTVVTVENWGLYQDTESENEQQMNNKRTTNEQQMNTNKNVKNVKEEYIDEFEIIWQLYPNKKGKAAAMKKYPSLRSKHSFEDLQRAVKKYADDVKGQDVKYIKHGSTFFNGGYLDYIEAEKPKKVVKLTPRFEDYLGNGSV
jgi:hypothetical protein